MSDNLMASSVDEERGSNKRVLFLAGGAAGVLALGGGGFMLLHHGSSDNASLALPVVHHAKAAAPAAKAAVRKSTVSVTKLPHASSVKIGRDPFSALYVVPVAAPATAPNTTSTSSTSTSTSSTTSTAAPARYTIVLTKVTTVPGGAKLFTFKIGTTSKSVLPAQRFGNYGELVVLTYLKNSKGAVTGAVLQVGDDNPIEVPIGV
jgi:hypothetical protein